MAKSATERKNEERLRAAPYLAKTKSAIPLFRRRIQSGTPMSAKTVDNIELIALKARLLYETQTKGAGTWTI